MVISLFTVIKLNRCSYPANSAPKPTDQLCFLMHLRDPAESDSTKKQINCQYSELNNYFMLRYVC